MVMMMMMRGIHCCLFHSGPIHTNPFSNENGAVLLRIRLSSTLQRRKRSPKREPFENALQSGAIWKRCFWKTLFSSVDGENDAIWKRRRHQDAIPLNREYPKWRTDATMWLQFRANFVGRYIKMRMRRVHLSMRTEGIKAFSKRIRRCSMDGRKRYENDKCGRKSFLKTEQNSSVFVWKRISVDRASGKYILLQFHLGNMIIRTRKLYVAFC